MFWIFIAIVWVIAVGVGAWLIFHSYPDPDRIDGLGKDRAAVIPGGLAIMLAAFSELGIERRPRPHGDVRERGRLLRVGDQEVRGGRREPQQTDGDGERLRPGEGRERVRVLGDAGERHAGQTRVGRGRQGPFERRRREIQHLATVARRPHASAEHAELTGP
jgi:hypothetical protein